MMNVAMWSHEEICVHFQENNNVSSFCKRPPLIRNHSLECKSALIGMISPELCESGICMFGEWVLYIRLAKLFDLALNLAALVIAGLEYGRYIYGSYLPLLRTGGRPDGNKFYRTLRFTKLGLIILGAVICNFIPYFCGQFNPVAKELVDMGCLRWSPVIFLGNDMTMFVTFLQMLSPLTQVIQDLAYRCYVAKRGQRYMRLPTSIEPAPSLNRWTGLPTSIEPGHIFMRRRALDHTIQLFTYLLATSWGLAFSAVGLYLWEDSIELVRNLTESTTTQGVGNWCFYCPGDKPIVQLGAHVAVQYMAWFLVILTSMTSLGMFIWICVGCDNCQNILCCCVLSDQRD